MSEFPEDALRRLIPRASSSLRYEEEKDGYDLYETGNQKPVGRIYERELAELLVKAVSWLLPAFNRIQLLRRRLASSRETVRQLAHAVQNAEGRKKVTYTPYSKEDDATIEEDNDQS